ncbi:hypothetical protein CSB37_00805 [bacterium DOLZORAL124_38_8]|nr:MAG: hypothetical protein CSB37_00805 [bacterium DOLZORAL124_38_8]
MFRTWLKWRIWHIIIDTVFLLGMFSLAYFVRVGAIFSSDFPFGLYLGMTVISTIVWILFLIFSRFYKVNIQPSKTERLMHFGKILLGGCIAIGVLIVSYFFPREVLFSRLLGLYGFLFGSAYLIISSEVFLSFLKKRKKQGQNDVYKTLIVGANRISDKIIQQLESDPIAPYIVKGVIDPYGMAPKDFSGKIIGKLNKLESFVKDEKITAIIQCDAYEHTINLISLAKEKNIRFLFVPALRGVFEEGLRIRKNAGHTMIQFVDREFSGHKKTWYKIVDWTLYHVFDVD